MNKGHSTSSLIKKCFSNSEDKNQIGQIFRVLFLKE